MTDDDLLNACLVGDRKGQRLLYDRFARKMMGVCMRYTKNQGDAQDVLQDGFVKVFQKLESFKRDGSLEGWIRRIMVNTALDYLRSNKEMRFSVSTDEAAFLLPQESTVMDSLNAENLMALLKDIPTGYKVIFNLFAIEGYSHKEIADELGITINTSKSQYSRARAHILKILEKNKAI